MIRLISLHIFSTSASALCEVIRLIAASQSPIFYYAGLAPGSPSEPTGGLSHSRGVGVEAGSKVTKSIACELLSASSVVTHYGSQAFGGGRCAFLLPSFVSFLHFLVLVSSN